LNGNAILSSSKRMHSIEQWSGETYFQVASVTIAPLLVLTYLDCIL